jgi:hypothetical protein
MSSALSLHPSSPALSETASVRAEIGSIVRALVRDFFDPYRPERHYMRGPGPKWRQKRQEAMAAQRSVGARAGA